MQVPTNGTYQGTQTITMNQPAHLVLQLQGNQEQKENENPQDANAASVENKNRSYAQTYWEKVVSTTVVLDKILEEIRNTRRAHVVNMTARLVEGVGYTAVGTMNALGNGDIYGGATNVMLGLYNLAMGAYGAKAVYDGAMESNSLSQSLDEIEQGIAMMTELNDANIEDAHQIADHLANIGKKLKEEQTALQELELNLLRQANNKNLEMEALKNQVKANVEKLQEVYNLLSEAEEQNTAAINLIQQGLTTLNFSITALGSNHLTTEAIETNIQNLKEAATKFIKGVALSKDANKKMHEGMKKVHFMMDKLLNNEKHALREMAHDKEVIMRQAKQVEKLKKNNEEMQDEKKEAEHKMRNVQKRMHKQNIIAAKTSQSVQNAKERKNSSENQWGVAEYISGATVGLTGGVAGFFGGGFFGMAGGVVSGFQIAGSSVHELRKKAEEAKKKHVASVQVQNPTVTHPVQIKFAPTTTSFNWMPGTTPWKDSATMGGFKILIGNEVYEGSFNTKANGGGSLDFEEELKLFFALSDAMTEGKITGNECKQILQTLNLTFQVPCERTEGKVQNVAVQLINPNSELFQELKRQIDALSQHNLENSLLMSTIWQGNSGSSNM